MISYSTLIFRFTGLYQGFGISLFGIIIFRACFFGSYDTMKALAYDDPSKAPIWMAFAFGFAAETIAGLVAYPIDTGLVYFRVMVTMTLFFSPKTINDAVWCPS